MDVTVREQDGTAIVSVDGRIDAGSAGRLDTALSEVLARGGRRVLVNLEKAVYMSSSGLRVLIGKLRDLRQTNGEMARCSLSPEVQRVFLLAGVHELFPVYVGLDEVFAEFEQKEKESQ